MTAIDDAWAEAAGVKKQASNTQESTAIAVIGAGVVGNTVALRLAQAGHEVTLVAPEDAGDGASFGNAGVIADYAVLPIGTPDVLRGLPSLMLYRDSPLAIRPTALPGLAPWLARFAGQSLPGPARRNAAALAALLASAPAEWTALAEEIGGTSLLRRRGVLHSYDSPREMQRAMGDLNWRKSLGVQIEFLQPGDLSQLEPELPRGVAQGGAAFFPQALSLNDPGCMMRRLQAAVSAAGVRHLFGRALALERLGTRAGVRIGGDGFTLRAGRSVIAAGAYSRPLARDAGDRVPLDTERGYHLEFDTERPALTRPLTPVRRGFYLVPMEGRLRVAGTVELGGLDAPPSARRLACLEAGARALLPDLPPPSRSWMGFRPSMPDSLPVIGPSRAGAEVLMAFGHGHLGLTLAPVTARLIEALVADREPDIDITPYLPSRFRTLFA